MKIREIIKEEIKKFIMEYGAKDFSEDEIRRELKPLGNNIIEKVLLAKKNFFNKKPASFYGFDMGSSEGNKDVEISGKNIIEYIALYLNNSSKIGSAQDEALKYLNKLV